MNSNSKAPRAFGSFDVDSLYGSGKPNNTEFIKFNTREKCFKKKGVRYRGITKLQKFAFYPSYSYFKASKAIKQSIQLMATETDKIEGSCRVGSVFDKQVQQSVDIYNKYHLPIKCFFDANELEKFHNTIKDKKEINILKEMCKCKNPYLERFWLLCQKLNWKPVRAQVSCCHPNYRIATNADLIIKDKNNNLKVIELKTGFEGYYDSACGMMNKPFEKLPDSCANQHQLQLAATQKMIAWTYKEQFVSGCILKFDTNKIEVRQLDKQFNNPIVLNQMFDAMNQCIDKVPD